MESKKCQEEIQWAGFEEMMLKKIPMNPSALLYKRGFVGNKKMKYVATARRIL